MPSYKTGEFTADTAAPLAGQRADVTITNSAWRSRTYRDAIVVRAADGTLTLADPGEYGRYEQAGVPLAEVSQVTRVRPVISRVEVLHGRVSPETAFMQDGYPYGRQLTCHRRVWIDGPAAKGSAKDQYRAMFQTNDPKRYGSGRYGEGPGGHPWNAPKPTTYHDWLVLYLDEDEHVHYHCGSLLTGLSGAGDARLRLDGTYAQLDENEREGYDLLVKMGQRQDAGDWEDWRKALEFFGGFMRERGGLPGPDEVAKAPGFYLHSFRYGAAVAAVTAGLAVA